MTRLNSVKDIPGAARRDLIKHLDTLRTKEEKRQTTAAQAHLYTNDQVQRAAGLVSIGRIEVYNELIQILTLGDTNEK